MTENSPARMPSPEGRGNARKRFRDAWDAYSRGVNKVAVPLLMPAIRWRASILTEDMAGFWLLWQLEGGFEGLERTGMSKSAIYRRISLFKKITGRHPDEFDLPGVTVNVREYLAAVLKPGQMSFADRATHPARDGAGE